MLIRPDCVDAEPVRERLRAAGFRETADDIPGVAGRAEVWIYQGTPPRVEMFWYCAGDRDKFLAKDVLDAGV